MHLIAGACAAAASFCSFLVLLLGHARALLAEMGNALTTSQESATSGVPDSLCTPRGIYKSKAPLTSTDIKRIKRLVKKGWLAPFWPPLEVDDQAATVRIRGANCIY